MGSMGYEQEEASPVAEDNIACIYMSKTSLMYHKSKHIDVQVYRLREFVTEGTLSLYHVPTGSQVADALTKSLSAELLRRHRVVMLGMEEPSQV